MVYGVCFESCWDICWRNNINVKHILNFAQTLIPVNRILVTCSVFWSSRFRVEKLLPAILTELFLYISCTSLYLSGAVLKVLKPIGQPGSCLEKVSCLRSIKRSVYRMLGSGTYTVIWSSCSRSFDPPVPRDQPDAYDQSNNALLVEQSQVQIKHGKIAKINKLLICFFFGGEGLRPPGTSPIPRPSVPAGEGGFAPLAPQTPHTRVQKLVKLQQIKHMIQI